ncbi:MAG: diguanylate cyclase [Acidobacteriota bacterium]
MSDSVLRGKILVADDSPTISSMLSFMLESQGYQAVLAKDGIEAIVKAYQERPDLILLDIEMPRMNGYQTCRLLKDDAPTKRIPIIMLTSKDQRSDRFWGLTTGADEYLTKDFEPEDLFALIERCLDRARVETAHLAAVKPFPITEASVGESDMLERVNNLLDRKLFQTTILNEVAEIAKSIHDHRAVIRRVLEFLYRVLDYKLAGMFLAKEGRPEMTLAVADEGSAELGETLLRFALGEWERAGMVPARSSDVDVSVVRLTEDAAPPPRLVETRAIPLEVRGRIIGLLCVATAQPGGFSEENLQTLRLIANHGVVVVDNAILYAMTEQLAQTDGLTGLYNHRCFKGELKKEVERSRRFGLVLSLMMLDIDFFKSFNDTYGHPAGDVVIRTIATIIKQNVRDVDFVARYGGEEFAVILLEADQRTAAEVAERVRAGVERCGFPVPGGTEIHKTVSIGLCTCKDKEKLEPAALIQKADDALFRAKDGGRNLVVLETL